ncbi:hypothetical protein KPH14_006476 [Odynerus spinipes]|uniref:Daxx histone-binding domain-containing protein n=1 Tax=Odynerus spinipes TaxID=1348599 RepID=A0AAD9RQY9_9HYME|nr:hypothetical protein KPH14_006476 [Odynerus spinipes]
MDKTEVICISSDDEDESEKVANEQNKPLSHNETDTESNLVNKNTEFKCDNERNNISKQKRKISEVDGTSNENTKKIKAELVTEANGNSVKINSKENNIKSQEGISIPATKEIMKPQLIIKEKKSISHLEQDVFPMFISLCLQKKREPAMEVIVNKLKRRYEQMDPICARSEAFQNFVNTKRNDILTTENMIYQHIMDVMTEMKSKPRGTSKVLKASRSNNCKSTVSREAVPSSTFNNIVEVERDEEDYEQDYEEDTMDPHTKRKYKKIVQAMKICENKIKMLEEAEVDFDDDDNSNYIKLERYKERMVTLYAEYCNITGDNIDAGRSYLRPKHLNTTQIVSVDQAITNFINAKITKRNKLKKNGRFTDDLIFPDYRDILKCVSNCNEKNNLGLDKRRQCQIAKKAFIDLGEHLQRARRNDYWDTFSLFLENKPDDPALKNQELAQKLRKNRELGEQKLTQVFHEYVKKQEEMRDLLTIDKADTENDDDEDNNLESNDENENSEEDDEDNEDEDENDNVEGENENDEDIRSIDNSEQSGDEKKNDDTSTSNVNDIKNGTVEHKDSTKINVIHICENKSSKDVTMNTSEIKCDETQSRHTSILRENVIEESSSTTKLETVIVQELSTSNNNTAINENEDRITEVTPLENDCDTQADENKPLLRVRSFAKPPTTWEDNKQRSQVVEDIAIKEVIDLTSEIPKANIEAPQFAIKIGNKVVPLQSKYNTVVIPANLAGKSVISVKNITNNYVKLNTRNMRTNTSSNSKANQIAKSLPIVKKIVDVSSVNTIIRLPHVSAKQNTNVNPKNNETKQKPTVVRFVLPTNQVHQNNSEDVPVTDTCQKEAK